MPQINSQLPKARSAVVDVIHQGQGTVRVLNLSDGTRILRLDEDFRVTNGPDLYVYLSADPEPHDSAELHNPRAFELGRLKGNVRDQNYTLPAGLNLSDFQSAVIYCRRFGVVFSSARLKGEGMNP